MPGSWQLYGPIVAFLVVNRLVNMRAAVIAATVFSLGTVVHRRRNGLRLGRFFPIVTVAVVLRGALSLLADDPETMYFGLGIAAKVAGAAFLAGSVLVGRPFAAAGAPYLLGVSDETLKHRAFVTAMRQVTMLAALYYLATAGFDTWLLDRSSTEGFVIGRFLATWPFSLLMVGLAFAATDRQLRKIEGLAPLSELLERQLGAHSPAAGASGAGQ